MDHLEHAEERLKSSICRQHHSLCQIENGSSIYFAQRINFLKRKKIELAQKLDLLDKKLQEELDNDEDNTNPGKEITNNKLNQLSNIVLAHRLTGISVYSIENGKIVICFDNSWKNQFCSTDYVELVQKSDGNLTLGRYTLPCFIPVVELADKYLLKEPQVFVSRVSDYLFALVTRREETKVMQVLYEDSQEFLTIESTEPFDYVQILIGKSDDPINLKINIMYEDLLQTLPTKVQCHLKEQEDLSSDIDIAEETLGKWEEQMELLPLSKALPDIIRTLLAKKLINTDVQRSDPSEED